MKKWYLVTAIMVSVCTASGQFNDIKCNPCRLDSLIGVWRNEKHDIVFDSSRLQLAEPVYVELVRASFKDIADTVFKKQSKLGYYFNQTGQLIITAKDTTIVQVPRPDRITVTGQVLDSSGNPVPLATIELNGKMVSKANDSGFFKLEWSQGDYIHVSHVNFEDTTLSWRDTPILIIHLYVKIQDRDPANFSGYQVKNPIMRTATVSVVIPNTTSNSNVADALKWVPGALVSMSSGVPGISNNFKLRGNNFIDNSTGWQYRQGNEPLLIVDGMPFPLSNIPLSLSGFGLDILYTIGIPDIEDIMVLRDAEATGIYGARGANGVILVRTKKARYQGPQWDIYVAPGFGRALGPMNDLMNTSQYRTMRYDAFAADGQSPTRATAPDLLVWDSTRYVNFKKWLLDGLARRLDTRIAFANGIGGWRYLISGSYHHETTVLPGEVSARRVSLITDLSYSTPQNKLQLGFTGFVTETKNNWTVDNPMEAMFSVPNLPRLFNNDGSYSWQQDSFFFRNPWSYFLKPLKIKTTNILMHAFVNYEFIPRLHGELRIGYNRILISDTAIIPIKAQVPTGNPTGSFSFGNNQFNTFQMEPQLNYNYTITAYKVKLEAMVAGSILEQINTTNATAYTGYTNDNQLGVSGIANDTTNTQENLYRFQSSFARLNVSLKDLFFLSFTGRFDFSSRFGSNNRKAQFFSIGAGLIIYKENPKVKNHLINFVKFRGSYGTTGNDRIGDYKYLATYSVISDPQNYLGMPVARSNEPANPNYQWETNEKLELALETKWFNKKFFLNFFCYRNRSSNLLLNIQLPSQTGYGSVRSNFPGVIQNSGLELEAATQLGGANFSWTGKFMLAMPRNKLVRFPNLDQSTYRNTLIVGESVNTKRVIKYDGVDKTTGFFRFKDTTDKATYDYDPKAFGGLLLTFTLRSFELTTGIEFRIQKGPHYQAYLLNHQPPGATNGTYQSNQFVEMDNHWTTSNKNATWQKPSILNNTDIKNKINSWLNSDAQAVDASFARWKLGSLKYFLSDKFIQKNGLKKAYIFCNVENVITVTSYKGADPEILNPLALPPSRIWTFGFQITF